MSGMNYVDMNESNTGVDCLAINGLFHKIIILQSHQNYAV